MSLVDMFLAESITFSVFFSFAQKPGFCQLPVEQCAVVLVNQTFKALSTVDNCCNTNC